MTFLPRLIVVACFLSCGLAGQVCAQSEAAAQLLRNSERLFGMGLYTDASRAALEHAEAVKRESEYGENHVGYARAIQWLATTYVAQKRDIEAEALFKRALSISQSVFQPGAEELNIPTFGLARFYSRQQRYAEVETLLNGLVETREQNYGASHPSLAPALRMLFGLYEAQGRHDERKIVHARLLGLATCDPAQSDRENLAVMLARYEQAKIGFQRKTSTGVYSPPTVLGRRAPLARRIAADVEQTLSLLSQGSTETAALIYDRERCVYLVSRDGIELVLPLSLASSWDPSVAVRKLLKVDARAAARTPKKRGARSSSDTPARVIAQARETDLVGIAAMVIPPELHPRLMSGRFGRLLILTTGDLASVPFAALPIGSRQLIDFVTPVVLADVDGIAKLASFETDFRQGEKLVVGDPDLSGDTIWSFSPLPAAREEAREVAALIGAQAVFGTGASKAAVTAALIPAQARLSLIYFATHGIADEINPMDASFLALKGSHLLARDIKNFKLARQPLVIMSACQTGLGKVFEGGIFGLARAWHSAGAAQIVMSLWNVDDAATRVLMVAFIKALVAGRSPEDALRSAMIGTREQYPDPALWAGFSLYGLPTPTR